MAIITESTELRQALRECQTNFAAALWFNAVAELGALAYPIYMIQVFDRVVPSRSYATMAALFSGLLIVLVFKAIFAWLRARLMVLAALRLDRELAERVFRALFEKSAAVRDETGAQALRDLTQFRQFFAGSGALTAMNAPWAGLFVGALFVVSPWVGATAVALVAIQVALMVVNMRATKRSIEVAAAARGAAFRYAEANIRSADAVTSMGMIPGLTAAWSRRNAAAMVAEVHGSRLGSGFAAIETSFSLLQQIVILSVAAIEIMRADLPGGFAFAAIILFSFVQRPIHQVIHGWEGYLQAKEAGVRLARLLEMVPPPRPRMALPKPAGALDCKGVVYFPRGAERPILRGLALAVDAGSSLGIVGPMGSGKTTLVRLMVGLTRPTQGEIRLDGADVWSWNRDELGRHVGYLPQEIGLVAGTVAENIGRFGLFDEEAIVAAAVRAGAHQVVLRLPRGYDTPIGEGGHPLSGGQRQLIGLARAVIGTPSLVVLDEPNSNLDGPGEAALVACIGELKRLGTTLVMVSHRPALVQDLDRIALLREGVVHMVMPADEFMHRSGRTIAIRPKTNEA
jgi:PrtD family type I secretion system ABC transporter